MKQLSGADSMFLQLEHGNNFMHVASLAIYDPSTAPGGGVRFKDVLRHFTSRLEQFPQFRRRLVTVPLSLDRPYWIEDPGFDVEFHVRHIALPHPGDWRQLCIQVARIHSRPLDRSKPLWEAYVIEGLHNIPGVPKGSFALYSKMHHAIIDGESGTELLKAMHSITPDSSGLDDEPEQQRFHADREPTTIELYSRALVHNVERVPALAKFTIDSARRLGALGAGSITKLAGEVDFSLKGLRGLFSGDLGSLVPKIGPQTRFSGDVSAHRVFEAVGLPLAEFKAVRQQIGDVTINDMFLCIVGGALRKYLQSKRELPDSSMTAMVPMTLRGAEKGGDVGNQVGMTVMSVRTDIADPVKRLLAIRDGARTSKRVTDAIGKEFARDLMEFVPNIVSQTLIRYAQLPRVGLIVSNVRGPDVPLYMAGARLVNYSPISIPIDGMGLNVTGFSYAGTMWICAVSCRDMLPDPAFFATCMRESFDDLKAAAARVSTVELPKALPRLPGKPTRKAAKKRATKRRTRRKAA
jgi:diacylglycerol O-acyltransferase / wax synthase